MNRDLIAVEVQKNIFRNFLKMAKRFAISCLKVLRFLSLVCLIYIFVKIKLLVELVKYIFIKLRQKFQRRLPSPNKQLR